MRCTDPESFSLSGILVASALLIFIWAHCRRRRRDRSETFFFDDDDLNDYVLDEIEAANPGPIRPKRNIQSNPHKSPGRKQSLANSGINRKLSSRSGTEDQGSVAGDNPFADSPSGRSLTKAQQSH